MERTLSDETKHEQGSTSGVLASGERQVLFVPRLTVKGLADKLVEIESSADWGFEHALLCLELLDYSKLCKMVNEGGPDNDPNLMPSRFCFLPGATDKGLDDKGNLDDFGPKKGKKKYELPLAPHKNCVQNLTDLLVFTGHLKGDLPNWVKDPPDGYDPSVGKPRSFTSVDAELVEAIQAYIADSTPPLPDYKLPETHTVVEGESLSSIAMDLEIRNWRLLWELNQDALGDTWDAPKPGTELKLPDPKKDPLGDDPKKSFGVWIRQYSNVACAERGYQYPGIYLSLTLLDGETEKPVSFDPAKPFSVHLRKDGFPLIHHVALKSGDQIDLVAPDSPLLGWGAKKLPVAALGRPRFYWSEDSLDVDEEETGIERNRFPDAHPIFKGHRDDNKDKQA